LVDAESAVALAVRSYVEQDTDEQREHDQIPGGDAPPVDG
jgi:hypothetical protein